jgi:hypothetical protein
MFKFRPHHLVCNLCFQNEGYDEKFVENFSFIHKTLLTNPNEKCIKIVNGTDDICSHCPRNTTNRCAKNSILIKHNAYLTLLQLSVGEIVSLNDTKTKVKKFLSPKSFQKICGKCQWKHLCEPILDVIA